MLGAAFPFRRIGLQQNPFRTLPPEAMTDALIPPLDIPQTFSTLQVIGQRGRGKSSTLQALVMQSETTAYECLPRGGGWRYHTDIRPLTLFALDEAQRLQPLAWLKLLWAMRGKRLILGTHWDHRPQLWAAGRTVQTVRVRTSPAHLAAIITRRVDLATLPEQQAPFHFTDDAILWLWEQYEDDVRAIIDFLYRYMQTFPPPGSVTSAALKSYASGA
jgi:hypothetical protein